MALIESAVQQIMSLSNPVCATFDQLAEEVMELHLALRGKHTDSPALEWLEIATIALNALTLLPEEDVKVAWGHWMARHGSKNYRAALDAGHDQ